MPDVSQRILDVLQLGPLSQGDLRREVACTYGDLASAIEALAEKEVIAIDPQGRWMHFSAEQQVLKALRHGPCSLEDLRKQVKCTSIEVAKATEDLLERKVISTYTDAKSSLFKIEDKSFSNIVPPIRFCNSSTGSLSLNDLLRMGTSRNVNQESRRLISLV